MAQLHDTFELRYQRDAFSRPYNVNLNGDTVKLSMIKSGRMEYLPNDRALFITDSAGARQFRALNPARSGTGPRRFIGLEEPDPSARGNRLKLQWQFGRFVGPTQTDTLPDGAIRTIWNAARDTTFTIPAGRGAGGGVRFERDTSAGQRTGKIVVSNHGWLGFGLECRDCYSEIDATMIRQWRFPTFPAVAAIEPNGPAATAGVRAGDVLHSIDGVSIQTPAGAIRFSVLKAGDHVRLTLDRNGQTIDVVVTVGSAVH